MKTKEEILDGLNTTGDSGLPEISATDLLVAMGTYAQQAFEAARQSDSGHYAYADYQTYVASLQPKQQDAEAETIRLVAETIIDQFIPHDPAVLQFSFDFKTSGKAYRVHYKRSEQGFWEFNGHENID